MTRALLHVLHFLGDEHRLDSRERIRLIALCILPLMACRFLSDALKPDQMPLYVAIHLSSAILAGFSILGILLRDARKRTWILFAFASLGIQFYGFWPSTPNHYYLYAYILLLLFLFDWESEEERDLCLSGLKWVFVTTMFYAGMKKVMMGTYFNGAFLGFNIQTHKFFQEFFSLILSQQTLDTIRDFPFWEREFRSPSPALTFISNASYLLEVVPTLLLLSRKTRTWAVLILVPVLLTIFVMGRHIYFFLCCLALLSLFMKKNHLKILLALQIPILVYLLLAHIWRWPGTGWQ